MKNIIVSIVTLALVLVSCDQKNKEIKDVKSGTSQTTSEMYACSMHPEITGVKGAECSKCGMELTQKAAQDSDLQSTVSAKKESNADTKTSTVTQSSFTINEIVKDYLQIKNALAKDDSKGAATDGKELYATLNSINASSIDPKLKAEYLNIADDAKEHAKHIGDNVGKIDHQREHFVMLSKDVNDLIKTFGTDQKLYQDFCPMANEGKGAIWISEIRDIKNPYYGSEMLTCGSMRKAL
ncbi:DUF3347 domain-containing protein [Flavobacterium sp. LB2P74]|uniref:DUF3347 domain-containing protein n=1 Tax=Flavobacterium sp. LB2P74 TaxID=3401717 RepID=UPI003AB02FBA